MNKTATRLALAIFLTLTCCLTSGAKEDEKSKADNTPGLKIGDKAPDFELENQQGDKTKLSELLKKGPVAVVFHRSANW